MEKNKIRVGLIFGGKSGEHEVSLSSAYAIYKALDKNKYDIKLIGIDKKGIWHFSNFQKVCDTERKLLIGKNSPAILPVNHGEGVSILGFGQGRKYSDIDVFFPIIHGTYGEDGCLQGFLELLDVAYVGSGVLGSAVGMDKDVMKRLFRESGMLTADFIAISKKEINEKKIKEIIRKLKFPIFVKPANLGSSVGISKAKNRKELEKAILKAFRYDTKIIVEENIVGREIECSVLGNDDPIASFPGEIKIKSEFYSYDAKYVDENSAVLISQAKLPKIKIKIIRNQAIKAFKILGCEGMARADFFLCKNGKLFINEVNTLPGFTDISMYPKMFAESGISYPELLDRLIKLAFLRKKKKDLLIRSFR